MPFCFDWVHNNTSSIWPDIDGSISTCPTYLLFLENFKSVKHCCNKNQYSLGLVQRSEGRSELASTHTPIINDHDFPPDVLDSGFKQWDSKGISSFGDLSEDGVLMAFNRSWDAL